MRGTIEAVLLVNSPIGLALSWLVMLLAMMPLLLAQPLLHLWVRSLARRRMRAIGRFSVRLFRGLDGGRDRSCWRSPSPSAWPRRAATCWPSRWPSCSPSCGASVPVRQVCLNRCHVLPRLSPFGLAADRDCLLFGARTGAWCVGACWALMVVPLVVDDVLHLVAMLVVMLLMLNERLAPTRPVRWRLRRVAR